jgi:ATP-binding cassette subfamily E protein 1
MADRLTRIAIVSEDKCKPKKCRQECKKSCPVVKTGKNPPPPPYLRRFGV